MTLALEGVRLIDFGQYLAGPFGPMIMGDLGAEVIKVEPVTGDGMRMATKPFFGCQRGKRDIALNVKDPRGLAIALELIASADVVHHNMTAGVATKLGIDYAAAKQVKPDIVYCNTWAYGLEGPLARFGGLDPLYQASSGLEHESGAVHEGNTPLYYRFGMCDASNAMLSVVAVLGALYHRKRTGEGQEVWTSLFDGGAIYTSDAHLVGGAAAPRPHLDKDLIGVGATYRLYRTQDDDWICIAAITDDGIPPRCARRSAWASSPTTNASRPPRTATNTAVNSRRSSNRASHQDRNVLDPHPRRRGRPQRGAARHARRRNPPVRLRQRRARPGRPLPAPAAGQRSASSVELIDFSETPGRVAGPPPLVGQDTRAILHELGHKDPEIDGLIAENVCYEPDDHYAERFSN